MTKPKSGSPSLGIADGGCRIIRTRDAARPLRRRPPYALSEASFYCVDDHGGQEDRRGPRATAERYA